MLHRRKPRYACMGDPATTRKRSTVSPTREQRRQDHGHTHLPPGRGEQQLNRAGTAQFSTVCCPPGVRLERTMRTVVRGAAHRAELVCCRSTLAFSTVAWRPRSSRGLTSCAGRSCCARTLLPVEPSIAARPVELALQPSAVAVAGWRSGGGVSSLGLQVDVFEVSVSRFRFVESFDAWRAADTLPLATAPTRAWARRAAGWRP